MYITSDMLAGFESHYGQPQEITACFGMKYDEFFNLQASQKNGRMHDITFFIRKENLWIVNSKPWYPIGLYRIPSGGAKPNESIEDGTKREAWEETGCEIDLVRYFLRIAVQFRCDDQKVDWISHLVLADWKAGVPHPIDTKEIKEAKFASQEDFDYFGRIMLALDVGGLHYREFLHRKAFEILDQLDI